MTQSLSGLSTFAQLVSEGTGFDIWVQTPLHHLLSVFGFSQKQTLRHEFECK